MFNKSKIFTLSKKELTNVPFQLVFEDGTEGTDQRKSFAKYSSWALPQALAHIGKWQAVVVDGKYDAVATVKKAISSSTLGPEWTKGLLYFLVSHPRGTIIPVGSKATSPEFLPYSALVPLFLAAFKKYQDIQYSKWTNISSLVDKDLYAAMTTAVPQYTTEELLDLRTLGSTVKTGDKAGTVKNPISTTSLVGTGVEEFDKLPRLAKIMLTQVWLAHPNFRHEYMVLDPQNWDSMPKSLIDTELGLTRVEQNVPEWA